MGLAIAQVFAAQGYAVVIMSRNKQRLAGWAEELDQTARSKLQSEGQLAPKEEQLAAAVSCDVLDTDSVKAGMAEALRLFPTRRLGTAIYNASVRKKAPFIEQTEQQVKDSLQASVVSAFAFLQATVREMIKPAADTSSGNQERKGPIGGNILVTGATSATRGREGFAAFSSGKTGLRRLCEVAAREHGPDGVHVAHVFVDGLIDSDTARKFLGFDTSKGERFADGTVVLPSEAAKSYLFLAQQQRAAWTFEMDLRPAKEHF
ncbi:NAD(P)-binding protein [Jaminaea rosea]|uniref:NAD(P)-binding protein n=1 Tax=Jaminaea rosea TaxID=1569628 RepID=A0A316UP67_9BASI|nr:NAD(P)-binding protein [Jaminaea rosea]PWN27092.1 NAD(P)-binding protein [Jaminaea rosea]